MLVYEGKTKNVFANPDGTYTLKLKDDATGRDGVFDPGENAVGLSIEGLGRESLRLSKYYFEQAIKAGVPCHYLGADLDKVEMTVRPAKAFGQGLEFICRLHADGSFVRRYGAYVQKGASLDYFVEATIKDDQRGDPPIGKEAAVLLGLLAGEEYDLCVALTRQVAKIVGDDLAQKGLTLFDIKFEFGKCGEEILLIDEISAGSMRVYQREDSIAPMDLGKWF